MLVRGRSVLVRMAAMLVRSGGVLLGLIVTSIIVMVRGHAVVLGRCLVTCGGLLVVIARRVLGF